MHVLDKILEVRRSEKGILLNNKLDPLSARAAYIINNIETGDMTTRILVPASELVRPRGQKSTTALYIASKKGHAKVVSMLLSKGATWSTTDNLTPLHPAAQNGHVEIVTMLLREALIPVCHTRPTFWYNRWAQYKPHDVPPSPLALASARGHERVVSLLCERLVEEGKSSQGGVDWPGPLPTNSSPLWLASQKGHREVVKVLLSYRANYTLQQGPGNKKVSPLYIAAQGGHLGVVQELINAKADPTRDNPTALYIAAHQVRILSLSLSLSYINQFDPILDLLLYVYVWIYFSFTSISRCPPRIHSRISHG